MSALRKSELEDKWNAAQTSNNANPMLDGIMLSGELLGSTLMKTFQHRNGLSRLSLSAIFPLNQRPTINERLLPKTFRRKVSQLGSKVDHRGILVRR